MTKCRIPCRASCSVCKPADTSDPAYARLSAFIHARVKEVCGSWPVHGSKSWLVGRVQSVGLGGEGLSALGRDWPGWRRRWVVSLLVCAMLEKGLIHADTHAETLIQKIIFAVYFITGEEGPPPTHIHTHHHPPTYAHRR